MEKHIDPRLVSEKVPSGVKRNATFVIKLKNGADDLGVLESDITSDDNGIYGRHSCPQEVIRVDRNKAGKIMRLVINP